jgi:gliding motility-associated-like protein
MRWLFFTLVCVILIDPAFAKKGKRPEIVGQKPLSTQAGQPITIRLTDLYVESDGDSDDDDRDDDYPEGYTLEVFEGDHYSLSGNTVTPEPGFTGVLSVPVRVNDGDRDSKKFNVQIQVTAPPPDTNPPPANTPPVITGQVPLTIVMNQSLLLKLSHLVVADPDDPYPSGFTLLVSSGSNYTVSDKVVTPAQNFVGELSVRVRVNDGRADSEPFTLRITVEPSNKNESPVITGQAGLNTLKGKPVTIRLEHLVVTDPDNNYPGDFTLTVSPGSNYTVSNTVVTPAAEFVGVLSVSVSVNDGTSSSAPFPLKIQVIQPTDLQIIAQQPLETKEDSSIVIELEHLTVNDNKKVFPAGFSLNIGPGTNYTVMGNKVIPATDFSGNLVASVSVTDGTNTSSPFELLIVVTPVNDPPVISELGTEPLLYAIGNNPPFPAKDVLVTDVDDDDLFLAEVSFRPDIYQPGNDVLWFQNTENIQGVFDSRVGSLFLIGQASLAEYQEILRTIRYTFSSSGDTLPSSNTKVLYFKLNDGKDVSELYERQIQLAESIGLDIPNGFTPNNDNANDTWRVKPLKEGEWFNRAIIRVYDQRGMLVYESTGFEKEWDGTSRGTLLPPDTYYYTIELDLSYTRANYKGIVTILR